MNRARCWQIKKALWNNLAKILAGAVSNPAVARLPGGSFVADIVSIRAHLMEIQRHIRPTTRLPTSCSYREVIAAIVVAALV